MNKKLIYLSIKILLLAIVYLVSFRQQAIASCVGESTCEYQYYIKRCFGGPNNGTVCSTNSDCSFPSGTCENAELVTDTQTANCADLGASCTAGANPCVAPYILTSGSCQGAGGVCTPGQVVNQGCAANGCPAGTQRVCTCNSAGTAWTCTCDGNSACNPPPGQESCSSCSGSTCNTTQVPTGTCSTNCNACSGTPPPTNPPAASCTVSLSPNSGTIDIAQESSLAFAANATAQNGSITQITFSSSNTNVAIVSPSADGTSPYTTAIIPVKSGTTTLTASVIVNGSPTCSTTANITVTDSNPPSCNSFQATTPTVTQGANANFIAEITDVGANLIPDGSYESGGVTYWPYAASTNEWYAVDSLIYPSPGIEGRYFAKLSRATIGNDSYATTQWHSAGENLTGQTYTLEFLAKSHSVPTNVSRISLQREPFGGDWSGTLTPEQSATFTQTGWTKYRYNLTFPNPGNGSTTSRLRPVLRPADNLSPVYYDAIKVFKTSNSGVNPSTVRFYYMLATANPCVQANWTLIGVGTRIGTTNFYEINWNTTSVPTSNYIVMATAADTQGNVLSGSPVDCGVSGVNYETSCNATQTISACTPTCGPDTGCGTLNHTPGAVSNITVNGISGNNLNLSSNPLPRTISWTAATITSPATVSAYDVWLIPRTQATIPASTNACNLSGTCRILTWTSGTSVSLPTVLPEQTNNFDIVIRARTACGTAGTWTRRAVDLTANVSGTIYEDSAGPDGANNCIGTGTPIDISSGSPTVTSSTGGTIASEIGSSYTLNDVPYAPSSAWAPDYGFDITLNIANPDPANAYYCNCPGGSPTSCVQTDTASPATGQNFFVTQTDLSNGPWWQASVGNIYGTQGYTSNVPDTALTYLITQNATGDIRSAGIPLSGGTVTAGTGWWTEYNGGSTQPRANNTSHANTVKEDYNYFVRNIDLDTVTALDETITDIPDANTGTQIDDVSAFKRTGDLTLDIATLQTVTGGRKIVFFVSGNVRITNAGAQNRHLITVDTGSYFAIIAGGNIVFDNSVGNTCANPTCTTTDTNIDGVYIASNQLIVADNALNPHTAPDNMFVAEGTFVGWNGIDLQRTFDNTTNPIDRILNNTYATELFIFRPDFTQNTPKILQRPNIVWQEVN